HASRRFQRRAEREHRQRHHHYRFRGPGAGTPQYDAPSRNDRQRKRSDGADQQRQRPARGAEVLSNTDPGAEVARQRLDRMASAPAPPIVSGGCTIRVGVAGWTDRTLTARGVFYPDGSRTPEKRLRHYASLLPLVEVDTPFYALPMPRAATDWV